MEDVGSFKFEYVTTSQNGNQTSVEIKLLPCDESPLKGVSGPEISVNSFLCSKPFQEELYGLQGAFSFESSHFQLSYDACTSNCVETNSTAEPLRSRPQAVPSSDFHNTHMFTLYATNTYLSTDKSIPSFGDIVTEEQTQHVVKKML